MKEIKLITWSQSKIMQVPEAQENEGESREEIS